MRQSDKKIVLIDFGAVKEIANISSISDDGENKSFTIGIGTPGYVSSEQIYGRPNFSSDIYAAGVIAIQALTGISPLLLSRDYNDEFVWCQQAKVSDKLKNILNKMVRCHSNQRYQSATEVLEDLEEITNLTPKLSRIQQTIKEKKSITLLEMENKFNSKQSENSRQRKQKNLLEMEDNLDSKQLENSRQRKQKNLLEMEDNLDSKQTKNKQVDKKITPVVQPNILKRILLHKLQVKI